MANIRTVIYDILINDADLSNYIGDRVFAGVAPLETQTPLITINKIGGDVNLFGLANENFQISIWGDSLLENDNIKGVVVGLFNGASQGIMKTSNIENIKDTFDKETNLKGTHIDIHLKTLGI